MIELAVVRLEMNSNFATCTVYFLFAWILDTVATLNEDSNQFCKVIKEPDFRPPPMRLANAVK